MAKTARPDTEATQPGDPSRNWLADGVVLYFLCAIAVAQPLYEILSRGAEFFIARRSEPMDVLFMVVALSVILPGALLAAEVLVSFVSRRASRALHGFILGLLWTAMFLAIFKRVALPDPMILPAAALAGIACGLAFSRWRVLRDRYILIPALLISVAIPLWFLFATPLRQVVMPSRPTPQVDSEALPELENPVVLIVLDELGTTTLMNEAREIERSFFPAFHRLSMDSTWYRNATTVSDTTSLAVPALLTGKYPEQRLLPTANEFPENLFTLLGEKNPMVVFESTTELCPEELCMNQDATSFSERLTALLFDLVVVYGHLTLPASLVEERLPPISTTWHGFATSALDEGQPDSEGTIEDPVSKVRRFMRSIRRAKRPALYYLHADLPHIPWRYTPAGKRYAFSHARHAFGLSKGIWSTDTWGSAQGFQRHVLQTMFVDGLLAEILDKLEGAGLYDRSMIILTSDHGISFRPGDHRRSLSDTNYQDLISVPLLVKLPHQKEGSVSDRNVELIDVLPTIAAAQQITIPWRMDGQPLGETSAEPRAEKMVLTYAGERRSFSADFEEKYDTLAWKLGLMGSGTDVAELYGISPCEPCKVLIGQPTAGHDRTPSLRGILDLPHLYDVDPASPVIPAMVTGRIFGEEDDGQPHYLAVAVNGTFQAVTRTYREAVSTKFAALVPEDAFRPGPNEVEIFTVRYGSGGALRLSRVSLGKQAAYSLEHTPSGEVIHSAGGRTFPIRERTIEGRVSSGNVRQQVVVFRGWAVEAPVPEPQHSILVFEDNRFLFSGKTDRRRTPEPSKFKFTISREIFSDLDSVELRFFAVSEEGYASELRYARGFRWHRSTRDDGAAEPP